MFNILAASGPQIAIAPEELFQIGDVMITNSMLYGWVVAVFMIVFLFIISRKITVMGSKGFFPRAVEALTEFIYDFVVNSLGSRERARKYAPFFTALFFFALINNWMGLLPIVGHGITYGEAPLLRPFTADFNGTLSMALVAMVLVQVFAIRESGAVGHIRHFFAGNLLNPLTYVIGLSEVFTEFTRLFSLGLRLFLNVVIGEILIAIFAYLGGIFGFASAVPFTLVEVFVGLLQAYIFVLLTVSYLSMAISHGDDHEEAAVKS
ncbi:F0F1 ATP synthase subunit A [Candidatus Saccharibacteria bacterium]|nr:F0F1 ATP synthase subunit A [Candidatus Saccharibacteria bacterium]